MTKFISDHPVGSKPRAIVAIGASAGGLNPIRDLLQQIPADSHLAFVVMQHLDPSRKSAMPELARKWTSLPVVAASNNIVLKPNEVYLIPPGVLATIKHGKIRLVPVVKSSRHASPISELFTSLASSAGPRAMGWFYPELVLMGLKVCWLLVNKVV